MPTSSTPSQTNRCRRRRGRRDGDQRGGPGAVDAAPDVRRRPGRPGPGAVLGRHRRPAMAGHGHRRSTVGPWTASAPTWATSWAPGRSPLRRQHEWRTCSPNPECFVGTASRRCPATTAGSTPSGTTPDRCGSTTVRSAPSAWPGRASRRPRPRSSAGSSTSPRHSSYRLPELFADTGVLDRPAPYPASCRPQAWSSASAIALLSVTLGLDADVPGRTFTVRPNRFAPFGAVTLRGIRVGEYLVTVACSADGGVSVEGLPGGLHPPSVTCSGGRRECPGSAQAYPAGRPAARPRCQQCEPPEVGRLSSRTAGRTCALGEMASGQ